MKKVGQIMEELGFNKEASDDVKKAFIKHLIKEAHFKTVEKKAKNQLSLLEEKVSEKESIQLSLFDITGTDK